MNPFVLRTAFILLTTALVSVAAVDDILANKGTFKPRITVSDRYSESVDVTHEDGDVYRELVADPERIAINVVANLEGANTGVIDGNTLVEIEAGYFYHSATLGEAPDYKSGGKRATFPLTMEVERSNGDMRTKNVGSVSYVWNPKTLTVTVTCTDVEGAGVFDVAASDYLNVADPDTSLPIENDPIDVAVVFGNATGSRTVFLKGTTRTAVRTFGSVARGDDEEFELCDVTIHGAADTDGPAIKSNFPPKSTALNQIDVSGTAEDIEAVTLDSVTVNGLAAAGATVTLVTDPNTGISNWSVTGIPLTKGANAVVLTFTDEDGNESKAPKNYTVK